MLGKQFLIHFRIEIVQFFMTIIIMLVYSLKNKIAYEYDYMGQKRRFSLRGPDSKCIFRSFFVKTSDISTEFIIQRDIQLIKYIK